ncbi:MAG: septum site-determining protein MinC [Deinococcus sp.]|nr:septum site-determining protein MinC [Deinococcus sp.]
MPAAQELADFLTRSAALLTGARVYLDPGEPGLSAAEIDQLRAALAASGITLAGIKGFRAPEPARPTKPLEPLPQPKPQDLAPPVLPPGRWARVLPHGLRSGGREVSPVGLVVMGDVNSGAEVVAAGDIIIMGTLRGVAHAGSEGDETSFIWAWVLQPTQLRIANVVARAPEGGPTPQSPEMARLKDRQLLISRWRS